MELSNRLQAVADMVTKGNCVADIGCDHGYVAIYLITEKIAPKVVAMDVNRGPLDRAREHIREQSFENKIETRLSDGAKALQINKNSSENTVSLEVDTILIAGMGGRLIQKILTDSMDKIKLAKEVILQPQSDIGNVRKFLEQQGFAMVEENMIYEEGKYYPMMKIVPLHKKNKVEMEMFYQSEPVNTYSELHREVFYQYGYLLLQSKNLVLKQYLEVSKGKIEQILTQIESMDDLVESTRRRVQELKKELEMVQLALTFYEMQAKL
ncbi:MAG: class I SAM-dependent methyltransferase [Eubacteriales bacterium]